MHISNASKERRVEPRVDINFSVRVAKSTAYGNKDLIDAEVKNISTSGILLYSLVDLAIATELDIRLDLPVYKEPFYGKAVIMRKQKDTRCGSYLYGCSLQLQGEHNLDKVKDFVQATLKCQNLLITEDNLLTDLTGE